MFYADSPHWTPGACPQGLWRMVTSWIDVYQQQTLPSDAEVDVLTLLSPSDNGAPVPQTDFSHPGPQSSRWSAWRMCVAERHG